MLVFYKSQIFPVNAEAVALLREKTGARLMDCKQALVEAEKEINRPATPQDITDIQEQLSQTANDPNLTLVTGGFTAPVPLEESDMFLAAVSWLRKKNLATGAKNTKDGTEGRVAIVSGDGFVAGIVISCETDFVAKNSEFITVFDKIVDHIVNYPRGGDVGFDAEFVHGTLNEISGKLGESIKLKRSVRYNGSAIGSYLHHDYKQGAIVALIDGGDAETARQVAMHCVFAKPKYGIRGHVPKEAVELEMIEIQKKLADDPKNLKKPVAILSKIAEGQLNKFYESIVLVDQPFFKDASKTVGQIVSSSGARFPSFELLETK